MMEHALFFVQLMPGPDLEPIRRQAVQFNEIFANQFELSGGIDASNYVAFNQRTIDLARRFSDYKKTVRDQQNAGKWHTLVYPLFFTHTAREADRLATRLAMYNRGNIEFERGEVVDFWSKTMSEHSAFIAHLLDPTEGLLIDQAIKLENAFAHPAAIRRSAADPITGRCARSARLQDRGGKGHPLGHDQVDHPAGAGCPCAARGGPLYRRAEAGARLETSPRARTSSWMRGSSASPLSSSVARAIGRVKRRGPALPGLR